MSLTDKVLFGLVGVFSDVADWVYEHVFEGHEWRVIAMMLLLLTIAGGME